MRGGGGVFLVQDYCRVSSLFLDSISDRWCLVYCIFFDDFFSPCFCRFLVVVYIIISDIESSSPIVLVFFAVFVFIIIYLSLPLDDDLDVYFSLLHLFGSSRRLPVFPLKFKCLMRCRRDFTISLSFTLTTPVTYYFMFSWSADVLSSISCFDVFISSIVSFKKSQLTYSLLVF